MQLPREIPTLPLASLGVAFVAVLLLGLVAVAEPEAAPPASVPTLPPMQAAGGRVDTLFLGGYADGSFTGALQIIASDLAPAERKMVGRHLDRIFTGVLREQGLGRAGRLRVAYERSVGPSGATRSIRVLAAQAAVGGEMYTAFFFQDEAQPGYFDPLGRSLDPRAWVRPLQDSRISSPFGTRRMHPILGRVLPHTGTDYAAPSGTPVRATGDGHVSWAASRGGYGKMVELQHPNGYVTRYAHLSELAVRHGEVIEQGEVIGYVGMSGLATGPHLHYEVRREGRPVDPEAVSVDAGPSAEVGSSGRWAAERRELGRLLARTPTALSRKG